ncbi:MAG: tetratricopeptide repeat protein, partial [Thermoguttaceae bacterium]|nr:tetratricopeptide repeat protein [Thermoguttaceae bacterium]
EATPDKKIQLDEETDKNDALDQETDKNDALDQETDENDALDQETDKNDALDQETDENDALDQETDENNALDQALAAQLDADPNGMSAEDLLNLATELKLSAANLLDLSKVIRLCEEAQKKGLDEVNAEFAKQLLISSRLDRGLGVAQLFLSPELPVDQLPRGWENLRDVAIEDLQAALTETTDIPLAQLALGRLFMLAEKNDEAKKALDLAVAAPELEAEAKTLALLFRAELETSTLEALALLEKGLEFAPEAAEIRSRLAAQYLAAHRVDAALAQIDKALELEPENADFKKLKANILAQAGKIDEARALFDEATKDAGDNILVQIERGQFLAAIGEHDKAIENFDKLIEKYDAPGLYYLRAVLYLQTRDYEKALADVNKSLRQGMDVATATRLKGVIYLQIEKYDDAIRTFKKLLRHVDHRDDAVAQIAYATAKKGLYKSAAKMLNDELEKNPESTDFLRTLADMELMFGHWEKAAEIYERILKLNPTDSGVLNNYAWLLATCPDDKLRDGKRALEMAVAACEITFYAEAHILSTLASAHAELGDFEKAREWSRKAVELGEKEKHESLDNLKAELASYEEDKPWRETSEIVEEVDEDAASQTNAETDENAKSKEKEVKAEDAAQSDAE